MKPWSDNQDAFAPSSYRFFRYLLVELDLRTPTLAEAIAVHRFHASRLVRLENDRKDFVGTRTDTTASNRLFGTQSHSFRGYCRARIAKTLERRARRRLLSVTARSTGEARQKVLYVIAAIVAGRLRLEANDIERVVATIEGFSAEVEDLFDARPFR